MYKPINQLFIKLSFALPLLLLFSTSCISFNTTGLKYLSQEQKEMITTPSVPLGKLPVNDTIYTVNDTMVKEWLRDKDYAVVHSFLTWCKGKYCVPPAVAHKNLKDSKIPFLMIAGDFESKNGFLVDYPFMCVDFDYYNTNSYSTGIERMYRALGCGEDWSDLYFLFNNGEYVASFQTLDELMAMHKKLKHNS